MKVIFLFTLYCYFNYFDRTPIESIQTFYLMAISILGGIVLLFQSWIFEISVHRKLFLQYFILVVVVIIVSAYQSNKLMGQPFMDGIIANYKMILAFGPFFVLWLLMVTQLNIESFNKTMIYSIWINLVVYVIMNVVIPRKAAYYSIFTGAKYEYFPELFQRGFIIIGIFFYFLKYRKSGSLLDLLACFLLFILPQVIELQRGQFVVISIMLFILSLGIANKRNFSMLWGQVILGVGIVLCMMLVSDSFSGYILDKLNFFNEAIRIFTGEESGDQSTQGRVTQFLFIYEGLSEHYLLGNGMLRSTFINEYFGEDTYFHVSDLGPIGAYYCYGILFILLVVFFISFHRTVLRRAKYYIADYPILHALIIYELYLLLNSIQTAKVIWKSNHFIMLNVLIMYYVYQINQKVHNSKG